MATSRAVLRLPSRFGVAIAALVMTMAACGAGEDSPNASGDTIAFAHLFGGRVYSYPQAKSPRELGDRSGLIVFGRIVGVVDGPLHGRSAAPLEARPTITLHVSVSRVEKGSLPEGSEQKIYVELLRGARSTQEYAQAAPRQADARLFLTAVPRSDADPIEQPERGRPKGQPLWGLTTPQGLFIDAGGSVVQIDDVRQYEGASLDLFRPSANSFPPDSSVTTASAGP